jgi:ligand-binding SRPBCC domain-containing protein
MPVLELQTVIHAPVARVFDLARSIEAHQDSAGPTGERAVEGVVSGLIGLNETVTWEARHLGVQQRLAVRITRYDRPVHFQDVMIRGAFRKMRHDHFFERVGDRTIMRDRFEFCSPGGPLGWLFDQIFLAGYMRRFLERRNAALKHAAESDAWIRYLGTLDHV